MSNFFDKILNLIPNINALKVKKPLLMIACISVLIVSSSCKSNDTNAETPAIENTTIEKNPKEETANTETAPPPSTSPPSIAPSEEHKEEFKYFMFLLNEKNIIDGFKNIHYFDEGSGSEEIILFANYVITDIKVTQVKYMPDNTFALEEELYYLKELPVDDAFCLRTVTPEGIPFIMVSFVDANGNTVEHLIGYDGKHGGIGIEGMSTEFANGANLVVEDDILMNSRFLEVDYGDETIVLVPNTGPYTSAPVFSPNRNKIAYISPFEWETLGTVYVFDSTTKQTVELNLDISEERTPIHLNWFDDENLIITDMFGTGTVARGGDSYLYNTVTGEQKKIITGTDDYAVTISSIKTLGDKLLITVAEYTDDIFNEYFYYDLLIDCDEFSTLSDEDIIHVGKFDYELDSRK